MTKLEQTVQEIKERKKIGLMTHVVIGYPSLEDTVNLVKTMADNGVDIIELQIPFSDPLADGATIMRACEVSLERGTKVKDAFAVMKQLSQEVSIPLVFMGYYNSVFTYGTEKFCKDAKDAGANGLIIPDIPLEEEREEKFIHFCKEYSLNTIRVVSPRSTDERLEKNAAIGTGFVYCTSRQGTTGVSSQLPEGLTVYLEKVKEYFTIPVAVGFGISKKEHIQALQGHADIAVIGSALIDVIANSKKNEIEKNVADFLQKVQSYDR